MAHLSPLIAALVAATFVAPVAAQTSVRSVLTGFEPVMEPMAGGGWRVVPNAYARTETLRQGARVWEAVSGGSGGVRATDTMKLAGRAGPLVVQAAQRLTVAEAAAVAARCLGNPLCIGSAASVAIATKVLWDGYRTKAESSGGLVADPGQGQQQLSTWCLSETSTVCGPSPLAAYNAYVTVAHTAWAKSWTGSQVTVALVGSPSCNSSNYCTGMSGSARWITNGQSAGSTAYNVGVYEYRRMQCPAVVDFDDPRYSTPGGPAGFDGKCPTGRYNPITQDEAAAKVVASPPPSTSPALRDAVREAIDNGAQSSPSELTTSGPASQQGTPESTTTTNGSGTTTTTKTPTYTYNYAGDTITYNTSYTTQTCTGTDSCSTTTTNAPAPTEQDPEDPCTAAPDRAGCAKLGMPPSGDAIKEKTVPVSVTPEGGFGASTGQCPAPIQTVSLGTVDPFGLVCTYMAGIRFAVVGCAFILACFIVLGRLD